VRQRHRWMVMMPFEIAPSDARKIRSGELPGIDVVPDTELSREEAPRADDPRPWFGLHNLQRELVAGPFCYVCEEPYSDELEAQPCPGDPDGVDLRMPDAPAFGVTSVGRNERCPCGSGLKWKQCHGR
jgi:hypothetical protein